MIFSDRSIKDLIAKGRIRNTYEGAVNPASLNVRLGTTFLGPMERNDILELGEEVEYQHWSAEPGQKLIIEPGEFMLATTMEWIDLTNNSEYDIDIAAFVQGRSSIGRIGLSVQNAGFVDPGFRGQITLELKNEANYPIGLIVGYPVAQLVFMEAERAAHGYSGKYMDQEGATGSRMNLDDMEKFGLKRGA